MGFFKFRAFVVILINFLLFPDIRASRLNVPRILLPIFNDFSTQFVLEATEGGCYKWATTRTDIIQLSPIDEDRELKCSTKVIVTTITREAARNIAVVLAEEIQTKQNLRCDVIVDVIHSLAITTTTRELFMEEAPEDFEVKAFDDQGNEFSSLEGIEFDWNIVPLGQNKDVVIRYITFQESPYETPPAIEALEMQNKKGYSILLEGVKSGSAKISVRLPYPEYKHVETKEVQLMIVANLLILPAEIHVMPGDLVPFKIYFLNNGRMEEINLPNSQYYIVPEDDSIAEPQGKTGNVLALKEGKTRIVLRDRNVGKDDPNLKLPAATLNVVDAEYIVLNILPDKNWAVLVGQHHEIVADVYSVTDHKLYLGESVKVLLEVTPEFHVSGRSNNGSWVTGHGVKPGIAAVLATLEGVQKGRDLVKPLKPIQTRSDLMIYPPIQIEPSEVILPWDPVTRPKYDIDLVAKGGDGRFLWTSSDHNIGTVSQSGHVHTYENGFFEVSAVMQRNHHNRQSAKFIILPPSKLEIVEFVMEAEIGFPVRLHVALYAEQEDAYGKPTLVPFTSCQELPLTIKQSDVKFKQNKSDIMPPVGISCGNIAMVGLNVGTSKVTVTYYQDGAALEDSVTISAYRKLELIYPKKDIVIAVGSSINLVYTGGPRPIMGRSSEHNRIVVSNNESIAQAQDLTEFHTIPGEDFTVVQVICRKLGETDIKLMISNTPTQTNCQGQTSSVTTRVTCGKPRKITLQPELKIADTSNCPMDLSSGNVVVQSTTVIDMTVTMYDDMGNKFLNISSFDLNWSVQPFASGTLLSKDSIFPKNLTLGTIDIADGAYQSFMPHVDLGNLEINVTCIGYRKSVLKPNSITAEWPLFANAEDGDTEQPPPITATLAMYLVEDTALSESSVTIFNHPGNKKTVSVLQGSGYFELALSSDSVADVRYVESTKELEIFPLSSGELTVQLMDLCLMSKPATLRVTVVSVGFIRIDMVDKVEIGKCIPCTVRLYDENDNLMDIPDINMVDLRPEWENKITNIQRSEEDKQNPWGVGEIHYTLTGVETGDTKLTFVAATNDEDVSSPPADLQVFNPLKLHPRNGTILIGSSLQLVVKGGPQPDTEIVFTSATKKTAIINDKGIVLGKSMGKTKITAQAIGVHPTTGQRIIYSTDSVEITVAALTGVKIQAPLTRFRVGAALPFWCFGVPDISPLVLGTVQDPPLSFRWKVDDKLLADLTGPFHPLGINVARPDRVALRLTGLQAGQTRVYVNVTTPGVVADKPNLLNIMFSAFIDIEIINELILTQPSNIHGSSLLMAPYSKVQLETNLDSVTKVTYSLPGDHVPSTELLVENVSIDDGGSSSTVVSLSSTGLLECYGTLGHALLIITSTDHNGLKQKINIVVEVKPIQYMSLQVIAPWRISFNNPVTIVPLGADFLLVALYHDNIGNTFNAGPTELKLRTSRCDLIKVTPFPENGSIWISTRKPGHTMMKVWADGIQKTAEYIKINVEQTVKPELEHLTFGDTVCLWTPVMSQYNTLGIWSTSDTNLMEINPAVDIGFVGNKVGTVTLSHSLLSSAPISVPIFPVHSIDVVMDQNGAVTNGQDGSVINFPIVLQSTKSQGVKTNNLIQGWRCRSDVRKMVRPRGFLCYMEFSNKSLDVFAHQLFSLSNGYVLETGQYACKLTNLNYNSTNVSTLKSNLILWVVTEDGKVQSERHEIKFLPGVNVKEILDLTEDSNTGELVIKGLPEVLKELTVEAADSGIIYISELTSDDENLRRYEVTLLDYHWRLANLKDAMGIVVNSPSTKQLIKVIVRVSGEGKAQMCGVPRSPILNFFKNYKYYIMLFTSMIIVYFMTFYFYNNYMQPIVNVNVQPRSPPTGSPMGGSPRMCAANLAAGLNRTLTGNLSTSMNSSTQSPCKFNCNCSRHGAREPIYGDASTFYSSSPDCVRRNRKYM